MVSTARSHGLEANVFKSRAYFRRTGKVFSVGIPAKEILDPSVPPPVPVQ